METGGIIKRLDEVVVNRIAAGEIIQRPANALKELLENSLDAKSTSIQITVKQGGLKYLQIQDNGTGIRLEDLTIVCERFTTSKLQQFEDLRQIATFGFRGEALASISHVGHLTIQTKTADNRCGYRATYSDGRLCDAPKACAGNQGTQITVEDLFFNAPQRLQAFKSATEEFQRISDVVAKYSVHNSTVSMCLKKMGEINAVLRTAGGSVSSKTDVIGAVYGADIARELLPIECTDDLYGFSANGYVTNINYSSKRFSLLLFINNRLVESAALKTALGQVYALYLAKGSNPFVYLSVSLDPANLDVNVHPTKHEVHFLYEDEIIERIKERVEEKLLGQNESRKYYTQTRLPGAPERTTSNESIQSSTSSSTAASNEKVYDRYLVRIDSKMQKLEKFFGNTTTKCDDAADESIGIGMPEAISEKKTPPDLLTPIRMRKLNSFRKQTKLTSILKMRKSIEDACDHDLRLILSNSIFVGAVNRQKTLIQHETQLYLCDTQKLSEEIFYQILLYDFENFGAITFAAPGLRIRDLVMLAFECGDCGWTPDDGPPEELAESVENILVKKSPILSEYFNFKISDDGRLLQLPLLLDHHKPSLAHLPMYLLRLATEVNWDSEQEFFEDFTRETATFYAIIPTASHPAGEENVDKSNHAWKWYVEHVLFAAIKKHMLPPSKCMHNRTFLCVANLPNLYKVFERC